MTRVLLIGDIHVKTFLLPLIDEVIEVVRPSALEPA